MVECKIELTFVKLGAAYYGIVDVEQQIQLMFVKLGTAYYGMWQSMIIYIIAGRCNNKVGLLPLTNSLLGCKMLEVE